LTESRTSICDHQSEINNSHGGLTPNRSPVQWNPGERYSVSYPCVGFWIFDCRFLTESRTSIFDHQSEINNSHGGLTSNRSPIQWNPGERYSVSYPCVCDFGFSLADF
jgi:hypothetical protein